ncbi:hypothetical protein D3C86_803930 [compost metagenome]
MLRVSSAERFNFLLASFCRPVRSNNKGGCSVTLLVTWDVIIAVWFRAMAFNASAASFLSSHLIFEILLKSIISLLWDNCICQ